MRLSNVVVGFGVVAVVASAGCSSSSSGSGGAGGSSSGTGGPACALTAAGCKTDVSDCVALVDNKGQKDFGLRISQLTVTKPSALASGVVASVINNAVASNYAACTLGSSTDSVFGGGTGTFSWLVEFDETKGTIKTGGAKPVADPNAGYCFVNDKAKGIAPFTVNAAVGSDGKFTMTDGQDLTVPIYLDATGSSVVLLPLHKARLFNGMLSSDNNCIGKYNAEGLDPNNTCKPDPENKIYMFVDGASLEGYVTIEEADGVEVQALKQSLCVVLSGQNSNGKCPRDAGGKITVKGDWCAAKNAAADASCADAWKLGATFSASAVKITGDCQ
jgi:hypothetical protein